MATQIADNSTQYAVGSDSSSWHAAYKVRRGIRFRPTGRQVLAICAACDNQTYVDSGIFESCTRALCERCAIGQRGTG